MLYSLDLKLLFDSLIEFCKNPVTILVAVNLLFYGRTLAYGLIIDDVAATQQTQAKKTSNYWKNMWLRFRQAYLDSPELGHLFNIAIHTTNTILVYYVFGANPISFLTALFFCINPVGNMASTWLSGRPYSVATSLILAGFLIPIAYPLFYGLAFSWSISTFMSPLIFLFAGLPLLAILLPIFAKLFKGNYYKTMKLRIKTVPKVMKSFDAKKLILVFKTYAYYTLLCIFPFKLGMCHSYLHTFGLSKKETGQWFKLDWRFFTGIAMVIGLIYLIITQGFTYCHGLIWFTIFVAQWTNWIVINHPITERYVYLANIGLMYFLAQLTIGTPLMYVFITMYAVLNWKFIPAYKDCLHYWKSNVENFPDVAMGYNQYGLELQKHGQVGTAFDIWIKGKSVRPNDFRINFNVSNLLAGQGRWDIIKPFIVQSEKSLDKRNNYKFWLGQVNSIKNVAKTQGVKFNISKKQEEKLKAQAELNKQIDLQERTDLESLKKDKKLIGKFTPNYLVYLQNKYKVKIKGFEKTYEAILKQQKQENAMRMNMAKEQSDASELKANPGLIKKFSKEYVIYLNNKYKLELKGLDNETNQRVQLQKTTEEKGS